jgi:hypothetical protein
MYYMQLNQSAIKDSERTEALFADMLYDNCHKETHQQFFVSFRYLEVNHTADCSDCVAILL